MSMSMSLRAPSPAQWLKNKIAMSNSMDEFLVNVGLREQEHIRRRTGFFRKDYSGVPFKRLSPPTIEQKRRLDAPKPENPLVRTEKMLLDWETRQWQNRQLSIYNRSDYHKFHESGTNNMPQRKTLGMGADREYLNRIEQNNKAKTAMQHWREQVRTAPKKVTTYY